MNNLSLSAPISKVSLQALFRSDNVRINKIDFIENLIINSLCHLNYNSMISSLLASSKIEKFSSITNPKIKSENKKLYSISESAECHNFNPKSTFIKEPKLS